MFIDMMENHTNAFFHPSHMRRSEMAKAVLLQTCPTKEHVIDDKPTIAKVEMLSMVMGNPGRPKRDLMMNSFSEASVARTT